MLSNRTHVGCPVLQQAVFDLVPAWAVLSSQTRNRFRELLQADESTWLRAKAYALRQAAHIIPYYRLSNPVFVGQAKQTIANLLA